MSRGLAVPKDNVDKAGRYPGTPWDAQLLVAFRNLLIPSSFVPFRMTVPPATVMSDPTSELTLRLVSAARLGRPDSPPVPTPDMRSESRR